MSRPGQAVLAFWHDIEPGHEAAFHAWHMREHLPERLAVPGFLRGRRYVAIDKGGNPPRFYNDYLVESPAVLTSPAYLDRLNDPSPWTQEIVPTFRRTNRSACRVLAAQGQGEGGVLATLRLVPAQDRKSAATEIEERLLPELHALADIAAVQLWQADPDISLVETSEKRIRAGETAVADWVVAIEGMFEERVEAAAARFAEEARALELTPAAPETTLYRLIFRLEAQAA